MQGGSVTEQPGGRKESALERLDRNFAELLQGFRVAVTGVQVLFAFLLTVPFAVGFDRVDRVGRWLFITALLSAAVATVCFIAPVAQHRILFRTGSKDILLRRANRFGIWGAAALTVSMASAATLVAQTFFSSWFAGVTAALVIVLCTWAWFLQPWLTVRKATRDR